MSQYLSWVEIRTLTWISRIWTWFFFTQSLVDLPKCLGIFLFPVELAEQLPGCVSHLGVCSDSFPPNIVSDWHKKKCDLFCTFYMWWSKTSYKEQQRFLNKPDHNYYSIMNLLNMLFACFINSLTTGQISRFVFYVSSCCRNRSAGSSHQDDEEAGEAGPGTGRQGSKEATR